MHFSLSRLLAPGALLASLAASASLLASCGGDDDKKPTLDPPQVTLNVPEPNTAAPTLKIRIIVSGCDQVAQTEVYDRTTFLKTVAYTSGSMDFELAQNEIPYTSGLAAKLALNVKATCSDGRFNVSQPQAATFLPVTKVVKDADPNGQVVTDFFTVEGSGASSAFVGCGNPTTGVGVLYRVDGTGAIKNQLDMGIPCSPDTVITDVSKVSNKRWVWTPGYGAIAVNNSFQITARTQTSFVLKNLTVMDDGNALVSDSLDVARLNHTSIGGTFQWIYKSLWAYIAPPKQKGAQVLVTYGRVPSDPSEGQLELVVTTLDANSPGNGTNSIGTVQERVIMEYRGALEAPPLTTYSPDASVIYVAFPFANNQARVQACAADKDGCEGSALKWFSPFFPVELQGLFPYAGGSRLAVVGLQRAWFLDSTTGLIMNKDQKSVDVSGNLRILQVQQGLPTNQDFYLLGGAVSSTGNRGLPLEIVAVDSAEKGELFRYEVSSSLSCGVDSSGRLWMRTGNNLVQALPLADYRKVRP